MRTLFNTLPVLLLAGLLLPACSKGYRVRVSNFYIEKLDSVIIGTPAIVFTEVEPGNTTGYQKIRSGDHSVRCVTRDGNSFSGVASLAAGGEGDHTIQVDGLKAIVVLGD